MTDLTLTDVYAAVADFHERHHFPVGTGTRDALLLRLALLQEELGEVAAVVTKAPRGPDHTGFTQHDWDRFTEELMDVFYLWIGTAVHCGWTPEEIAATFARVHAKNLGRMPRHTTLQTSPSDAPPSVS